MTIPFIIGKNSSGDNHSIDLVDIPLLLISYSTEIQLSRFFKQVYFSDYFCNNINYILTNTRQFQNQEFLDGNSSIYFRDEPESGNIFSRKKLLRLVTNEIERRQQILKKNNNSHLSGNYSLKLPIEKILGYQFFIIDDVWDIIQSKPKSLGLSLMRIMFYGPGVGIHTIVASSISYRNLLQQLINTHPAITRELQKKYGVPVPIQMGMLGHELIFTPEDLVFYKSNTSKELQRFFTLPELPIKTFKMKVEIDCNVLWNKIKSISGYIDVIRDDEVLPSHLEFIINHLNVGSIILTDRIICVITSLETNYKIAFKKKSDAISDKMMLEAIIKISDFINEKEYP